MKDPLSPSLPHSSARACLLPHPSRAQAGTLLNSHTSNRITNNTNARRMAFTLLFTLDPTFQSKKYL